MVKSGHYFFINVGPDDFKFPFSIE
jgi:hypothetical protein